MIAYDLVCSNGHRFECWFRDSASFEEQKSAAMINCPVCNDTDVDKVFSSFSIRRKPEGTREEREAHQILRHLQEYVDQHFEDVGPDFAKEALRMHWGESEKRNIKGLATPDEEKLLREEGIPFFKVPIIKRQDN